MISVCLNVIIQQLSHRFKSPCITAHMLMPFQSKGAGRGGDSQVESYWVWSPISTACRQMPNLCSLMSCIPIFTKLLWKQIVHHASHNFMVGAKGRWGFNEQLEKCNGKQMRLVGGQAGGKREVALENKENAIRQIVKYWKTSDKGLNGQALDWHVVITTNNLVMGGWEAGV